MIIDGYGWDKSYQRVYDIKGRHVELKYQIAVSIDILIPKGISYFSRLENIIEIIFFKNYYFFLDFFLLSKYNLSFEKVTRYSD